MVYIAILHLISHRSFFLKAFVSHNIPEESEPDKEMIYSDLRINLFIVGFTSSSIQLLLMREIINISGGYELITGVFLASWLFSSAIGASLASRSNLNNIRKINFTFSVAPLLSIILLLFLSRLFLHPGETPSFLESIVYTCVVLMPFCIVSGYTFVKLITFTQNKNGFVPGKSFSIETAGGVAAGLCITLMIYRIFNTYELLLLIIALTTAYSLLNHRKPKPGEDFIIKLIFLLLSSFIIIINPDNYFRQILLPGLEVTESNDTPYGNITEGYYRGEKSIYYNQRLLAYNDDVVEREENIHYAMLQSSKPETVMLISGSLSNHLPEIIKYPVNRVIYLEIDPALVKTESSPDTDFKGELVIKRVDAFTFIRSTEEKADVIILLIPPPSTLQINRFYTKEFFTEVKNRLNEGGIFICSPGPGDTYFNKESLNLYSSVYNSMESVFKNIKPVIGNKLYLTASDSELSLLYCKLTEMKNIKNSYVSSDYLSDDLIQKRSDEFISLIDKTVRQNSSEFPVACFYFHSYNLSKDTNEKTTALILLGIAFALPLFAIQRENRLMFFTASSLAGFEIILLLTLQLTVGNMYQFTGLIIAGLMAGLAAGAGLEIRLLNALSISVKSFIMIVFYLFSGLVFSNILALENRSAVICLIVVLALIPAILTGNLFRELTIKTYGIRIPAATYSADLAGSASGFIFISGFAVPLMGIRISIYLLSALILAGFLFGTIRNKQ